MPITFYSTPIARLASTPRTALAFTAICCTIGCLAWFASSPLLAATWTVTTTADTFDGSCDPFDCSLREALRAASLAPGTDTVVLPAGTYRVTIAGANEDLGLTGDFDTAGDVTIEGAGAASTILDGNGLDRVLHIVDILGPTATVIKGVTITGGRASAGEPFGGGIFHSGAGISSTLTIDSCVITGNSGTGAEGGGISTAAATVVIRDSTISGNSAGGANSEGGGLAISTGGSVRVERSTVSDNEAGEGGGIVVLGGDLELVNSTVSGNRAFDQGGGLANLGGNATVINTTLFGNEAPASEGSAAYHDGFDFTFANTLLSGDCGGNGIFQSDGGNIESPGNSCGLVNPTDLSNASLASLALGPLADNGGATDTHELLAGSVAIDAGLLGPCPVVDQRGTARARTPSDPCDVGAFERTGGGNGGACGEDAQTLCLNNGRFRVTSRFRTPQGQAGPAQVQRLTNDTGYTFFFNADNVEMVVKVLDACSFASSFWVFAGGLTNVEVDLVVEDTEQDEIKTYRNPLGQAFQPIQDTSAFATCP